MAHSIFARNFRGFKEIDVGLDEDIFLVGDNSSGKSSILHLINLIYESDLIGIPRLAAEQYVDRDDFFSPYFDYADVELGFVASRDDGEGLARIITLTRVRSASSYYVSSATFANERGVLSIRTGANGKRLQGRFISREKLPTKEELTEIHKNDNSFKKLSSEFSVTLNNPHFMFQVLVELVPGSAGKSSFGDIIFGLPLPSPRLIGPMRGQPAGFYAFDRQIKATGGHFATLLNDVSRTTPNEVDHAIEVFGQESGLFDTLTVKRTSRSLANSPLHVEVSKNGRNFLLNQVGIGVSQIAPIIADTLAATKGVIDARMFLLQQPELHLHPKAQAALGDYLFTVAQQELGLCIETHSDFLIDRYRSRLRDGDVGKAAIIYCTNDAEGNHARRIGINSDGTLDNPPADYLSFFINELARTMM